MWKSIGDAYWRRKEARIRELLEQEREKLIEEEGFLATDDGELFTKGKLDRTTNSMAGENLLKYYDQGIIFIRL